VAPEKALRRRLRHIGLGRYIVKVSPARRGHGGAVLIVHDSQAFLLALIGNGSFGLDSAVGRMLHRGTVSLREVSSKSGLHLSVKPDNSVDAHVDRVPPVTGTKPDGRCRYRPGRVAGHFRHDLLPLVFRHTQRHSKLGARTRSRSKRVSQWWPVPDVFTPVPLLTKGVVTTLMPSLRIEEAFWTAVQSAREGGLTTCHTRTRKRSEACMTPLEGVTWVPSWAFGQTTSSFISRGGPQFRVSTGARMRSLGLSGS
jgi:hypothetical protein